MNSPSSPTSKLIVVLIPLLVSILCFGQSVPSHTMRKLPPAERMAASNARNAADRKWAAVRRQLQASGIVDRDEVQRRRAEGSAEWIAIEKQVREVIDDYASVANLYQGSDVAAYCSTRISGVHQQLGDYDLASNLLQNIFKEYSGTQDGSEAIFSAGLLESQARSEYKRAIECFELVPCPTSKKDPSYGEAITLYVSAQEQTAKCEILLGMKEVASGRIRALQEAVPEFAKHASDFLAELEKQRP